MAPLSFKGERAVHGSYLDITELKETRRKLEELETLEASILDALPVAVIVLRERGSLCQPGGGDGVGLETELEALGCGTRILYRSDDEYEEIGRHLPDPVLRDSGSSAKSSLAGRGRPLHPLLRQYVAHRGQPRGKRIVATYEDITERKRAEAALKGARRGFGRSWRAGRSPPSSSTAATGSSDGTRRSRN